MLHALLLAGALAAPPLVEIRQVTFETPYAPNPYADRRLLVSSRAPVAYAVSFGTLFVASTIDGAVLDVVDVGDLAAPETDSLGIAISEGGTTPRLLVWRHDQRTLRSFAITDPAHPAFERDFSMARPVGSVSPLADGARAVVFSTFGRADLLDLDLGYGTFDFQPRSSPHGYIRVVRVNGTAARPVIAVFDSYWDGSRSHGAVTVYEASAGAVSEIGTFGTDDDSVGSVLVDREGSVVVVGRRMSDDPETYDGMFRYRVHTLPGGEAVSDLETAGGGALAVLAEGSGSRALVTLDRAGVDIVDLGDPAAPSVVGRAAAAIGVPKYPLYATWALTASSSAPVVFAAASGDREVLTIDIADATVVSRTSVAPAVPTFIAAREAGGARELAVFAARWVPPDFVVPGGTAELRFIEASNLASPRPSGRLLRNQPRRVDGTGTLGGRYLLALDNLSNVLALVRAADGAVLDITGLFGGRRGDYYLGDNVDVAGGYVLLFGDDSWHLLDVQSGRFHSLRHGQVPSGILEGAVRADGTVFLLAWDESHALGLDVIPLDGVAGRVPLEGWGELVLSPGGDLAMVATYAAPPQIIDVSDPARPVLLWTLQEFVGGACFAQSGHAVFATLEDQSGAFRGRLYDARAGGATGGTSAPVDEYYYHGFGIASEAAGISRAVVWTWTWLGQENAVFDTGGPTPVLLTVGPEYYGFADFSPRPGGGWYETHGDASWFKVPSEILIGNADGSQASFPIPGTDQDQPRVLRQGFFTTLARKQDRNTFLRVSLWRDTALNRPPIANAGSDRSVECADHAGTPVALDGSASTDPDSTPETEDDIASYAWSESGGSPVEGVAPVVTLASGEHVISLAVTDLLGAEDAADVTVRVSDTLPPAVDVALVPAFEKGRWTNRWTPHGAVHDLCDGDRGAPVEVHKLPAGAETAPVSFVRGFASAVELRSGPAGALEVKLTGPDEAAIRSAWSAAIAGGGFALNDGAGVTLLLAPSATGRDAGLWFRYELDGTGRLVRATGFGAAADLVVEGLGVDASGHAASASVSLRATQAELCTRLPGSAICAGANAPKLNLRSGQVSARR